MESLFVPYAESLALKQLDFDEPCFGLFTRPNKELLVKEMPDQHECELYFGGILAPTYAQAFRFFREFREYDDWCIESWIQPYLSDQPKQYEGFYWRRGEKVSVGVFSTYDEAQLNLLRKLIEIVKTKQ